jgi:hypothetical protein
LFECFFGVEVRAFHHNHNHNPKRDHHKVHISLSPPKKNHERKLSPKDKLMFIATERNDLQLADAEIRSQSNKNAVPTLDGLGDESTNSDGDFNGDGDGGGGNGDGAGGDLRALEVRETLPSPSAAGASSSSASTPKTWRNAGSAKGTGDVGGDGNGGGGDHVQPDQQQHQQHDHHFEGTAKLGRLSRLRRLSTLSAQSLSQYTAELLLRPRAFLMTGYPTDMVDYLATFNRFLRVRASRRVASRRVLLLL